ncbi:hypothetical protein J2S59_003133 [Nocardioides massiliensis]|uniref:Uncharacterized protein n=1 Tax=Nocardioides massiliensis TaxID=1325935 RepID=A0ABT9NSD5_9ACTN|nr:hypothetical protein [Nocardioides massiliensis]MDP9823324.1 hypothetical protein [Nocardioides massiliensis]
MTEADDSAGAEASMLDVERHPVFDTWQSFTTSDLAGAEDDYAEWPSSFEAASLAEPLGPINWNTLTADDAEAEWLDLNAWVNWLRGTYGLAPNEVPPMWHRHDELVWELSALHLHWLNSYSPDASPSSPLAWHRDFAEARHRLRDWVAACGTRLDRDRPTRQTAWPGEPAALPATEASVTDRDNDFVQFVMEDVTARRQVEAEIERRVS